ncbi:MAG: HEAT repeat domain-containing protein [Lentisphaeraceae bacterium]|nr:HEAT repeat domain-containing protein [Lentisphaeraceae bacterium]
MHLLKSLALSSAVALGALTSSAQNKSFKVPDEFDVKLFADSSMVNNPVSIAIDAKGRVYVAEVHRFQHGVEDSRRHNVWFLDELKVNSLQGRLDLYKKWTEKGRFKEGHFTSHSDRIVTLVDKDGDNKADKQLVYAGGFNNALDGNAGSILLGPEGEMYYANIPNVWKLTDKDKDGISESREKFITGFGFRNGVNGHDLHGLEWGVDGRLYFSNGDRGYSVTTQEGKVLKSSERGAIFRCEPDGSNLELFTIGNRNPQDLAFDQYGNLFTVDNNRGRGDRSRVCYLVELGDYGWNSGHENKTTFFKATKLSERKGPKPTDSWLVEGDWKEEFKGQAAYVIPPIFFIDGGSAGITFNPGESLGDKYTNKFMYSAYQLGIHAFNFVPSGAGLKKKESSQFWKGGLIMDTEFDFDGRFYVADYVATNDHKNGKAKGSIYVLKNDEYLKKPSVLSAAKILKAGFNGLDEKQLFANLFHKDMRVRLFSQFELAKRGQVSKLVEAVEQTKDTVARLHGIWGIGQLSRKDNTLNKHLDKYLTDSDFRVRAQVVKVLGESQDSKYLPAIATALSDKDGRVRFFAATAIGKVGSDKQVVDALVDVAKKNNDKDIFLRHSAVAGLIYTNNTNKIAKHLKSDSAAVRRVALLALERLGDKRVGELLADKDPSIVSETIRAVDRMLNDELTLNSATTLANYKSGETSLPETDMERLLQWSFRLGTLEAAKSTSAIAQNTKLSGKLRLIALNDLIRWQEIPAMDPVIGQIRHINDKRADVKEVIIETVKALLDDQSDKELSSLIAGLSIEHGLAKNMSSLASKVLDKSETVETRLDLLSKLDANNDKSVENITKFLVNDPEKQMRLAAYNILFKKNRSAYNSAIGKLKSSQSDLQVLYRTIQDNNDKKHTIVIVRALQSLIRGRHEGESLLELLSAAEASQDKKVKNLLGRYKSSKPKNDNLFEYRFAQFGGDAKHGRKLVYEQGLGQCIICHKMEDKGGVVAPDLSNLANEKRATSKYLLESLIHPGAYVVPGFGNVTLTLKNGDAIVGSLLSKDEKEVVLKMITGEKATYPMADVKAVTDPLSSMPPMGSILNKSDLRDVMAYLKTLKKADH